MREFLPMQPAPAPDSAAPHSRGQLLQYGLLAFPLAFAGLPIYVHAPNFYATDLGVSLATVGYVLLFLRIFDAVQDPLIGIISDRWHRQRRLILLLGMVMLGAGFWVLFHPAQANPLFALALGVLLCTGGFSIVTINFQALGGLWQTDSAGRTRITAWREAIGLIGLLVASVLPTVLDDGTGSGRAFHLMTLIYLPLLLVCGMVFLRWLRRAALYAPADATGTASLSRLRNGWTIRFFAIYFCNGFAGSIPAVLVLFFINDRIDGAAWSGVFLLLYFASGAAAMPVWQWAARRLGKARAWMSGMGLAVVTFVWAFTLGPGDHVAYGAVCILSGLALGADLALPPAIIADRITRQRDYLLASRMFAVLAFLSKAALALATGLALPMLAWLGYQPGIAAADNATDTLAVAYGLIPCLIKAAVAFYLYHHADRVDQG